jgi:hypothetical protein
MAHVGKTLHSFRKHELLWQVIRGQCHAQATRKSRPILLIDLTAGDGNGVPLPQPDLFLGVRPSRSSPEILYEVAQEFPLTSLVLCEQKKQPREQLAEAFPSAQVLPDSTLVPSVITEAYDYSLIVSDPNGMHHDIVAMQAIAALIPRSDFVLTLNEHAIKRLLGVHKPALDAHPLPWRSWKAQEKYNWMLDPLAWRERLEKRQVAWTRQLIHASPNFHYRIVVVAHAMSDVIRRHPGQWEIFP